MTVCVRIPEMEILPSHPRRQIFLSPTALNVAAAMGGCRGSAEEAAAHLYL